MATLFPYDEMTWDAVAALPRDTPLVLPLGSGYDLVLLSQILHSHSPEESIELLGKVRTVLNPKGKAVIHEFALAENRAAPVAGLGRQTLSILEPNP